jgi:hypothetical protein
MKGVIAYGIFAQKLRHLLCATGAWKHELDLEVSLHSKQTGMSMEKEIFEEVRNQYFTKMIEDPIKKTPWL